MTNNANAPELDDRSTAVTTQGHVLSEGAYLDRHFEAAREAYEEMAHYAGIKSGWKVLDAGAGSGSYLPTLTALAGNRGTVDAVDLDPENVAAIRRRAGGGEFGIVNLN